MNKSPQYSDGSVVLVCGGREYQDVQLVWSILDEIHAKTPITCVVQGGATGADFYAKRWAKERGVEQCEVLADWATHGRAAGPIRNQRMIDECKPTHVVAFPGGSGTADMVRRAMKASIPARVIKSRETQFNSKESNQ